MDPTLKQRLVGATVLVALGVIFIPMLLDGPADRDRESELRIPEPPEQLETRRLPLRPETSPPETADANDAPQSDATIPEVVVVETPRVQPSPVEEPPAAVAPVDRAEPESSPPKPTPAQPREGWYLQLGSFAEADNARALVAAMVEAGHPAYSEPVESDGRTLHRVRVGHWQDREAAAEAGGQIAGSFPDIEVTLGRSASGAPAEQVPEAVPEFGWMVQVGSFSSEDNALALRNRLREAGFAAHSDRLDIGGKVRFRVRVGPELERADAEAIMARLKREMGINGLVVSHP